jgi:hypothetical protein
VTHGGTSYKEAMKTMRSAMQYYIMSLLLIRESATAEIANEAKARSQKGFNASASNILNVISKGLAAKTKAGLEDPNIKSMTTSVMEGAYMVRETPETIYMAAKMLSEYEFAGLKGETRAFIKNYSRGVIKAWEDLHLRSVDFETLNEFEKRVMMEQNGRIKLKALPEVIKGP